MNPHAVKVMAEAGRGHHAALFEDARRTSARLQFDYVVTVCGHANEHCPVFPGKAQWSTSALTTRRSLPRHLPDGEEKLAIYRRVRDEIRRLR